MIWSFTQDRSKPVPQRGGNKRKKKKITVLGELSLGSELTLRQSPQVAETRDGIAVRNMMGSRIEYRLVPSAGGKQVSIRNDGFVNGFGIFGAPGSGKTHLVLHILKGVLDGIDRSALRKFGGLILDPKAGLLEDFAELWATLGLHRRGDLIIVKPDFLNYLAQKEEAGTAPAQAPKAAAFEVFDQLRLDEGLHPKGINVIDCALSPNELGRMLVLAAQSSGVSAKEPYWFLAWGNLFSAALTLLEYTEAYVPTITVLLGHILNDDPAGKTVPNAAKSGAKERQEREIESLARRVLEKMESVVAAASESLGVHPEQIKTDLQAAITQIQSFFKTEHVQTIESFIISAFGPFQQYKFANLSVSRRHMSQKYGRVQGAPSLYDEIIENGKVIMVTVGPEDPTMGKTLCTLVKCLFQQSVMSRLERHSSGKLKNFERPVFIACDEYAEIASEVPGQPMGDGRFFSLSRQNGCMGILATQSIHTLENSSLSDSWKSIFSNLTAKIFMGAADNETAEQAAKLAGELDWEMTSTTENYGKDNSFSHQRSFQQRPELTPYVLTHVLTRGQAACIGSMDGRNSAPALSFFEVPENYPLQIEVNQ